MEKLSTQREYKDRLFKAVFGRDTEESGRWRLELYNALNGSACDDPRALALNTIENVIYITMKNDVSFLIDDQISLYEQQSSLNQNMPLRGLFYFSQLYQKHLAQIKNDVNRSGRIKIPSPRFVVFYNGEAEAPDTFKMRLSESFAAPCKDGEFEWTATVINVNENRNKELHKKCRALYDYARFVAQVRRGSKAGLSPQDAVEAAVRMAIKEKLLGGFFERQRAEVIGMILTEFDEELFRQNCREDAYEEGYGEGRAEGAKQKAVDAARSFAANGVSADIIAKSLGMTLQEVVQIIADALPQNA